MSGVAFKLLRVSSMQSNLDPVSRICTGFGDHQLNPRVSCSLPFSKCAAGKHPSAGVVRFPTAVHLCYTDSGLTKPIANSENVHEAFSAQIHLVENENTTLWSLVHQTGAFIIARQLSGAAECLVTVHVSASNNEQVSTRRFPTIKVFPKFKQQALCCPLQYLVAGWTFHFAKKVLGGFNL